MNPSEIAPYKIGLIRTSSIGDVVLATACLSLLKQIQPSAKIVWLGMAPSLSLIRDAFPEVECIEISRSLKVQEVLTALSDVTFLIDLQTNLRSRIIAHAFKNRYKKPIFSSPKSHLRRNRLVLESRIYGRRRALSQRAVESLKPQFRQMRESLFIALQNLKIVPKTCLVPEEGLYPFLPTQHFDHSTTYLEKLRGGLWVGIAPGASYEAKQAPLPVLREILGLLAKSLELRGLGEKVGLVLLGDMKDKLFCDELQTSLNWQAPVLNLAGDLSLWENAVVLKEMVCLLSNDSALGHIAEAVGTSAVVLFGPTVEGFGFAPVKKGSRAFSALLGCRPCSKHGKAPCRFGDMLCFWNINRQEVANHIQELVSSYDQSNKLI